MIHSGVFTGVYSEIQNDLCHPRENCRFLSIQVDETTDGSTKEQFSVIIRLEREGEIVERFLKLFDVSSDRFHVSLLVGL